MDVFYFEASTRLITFILFSSLQGLRASGGRGSAVDARSKSCFIAIGHLFSRPSTQSLRLFIYQIDLCFKRRRSLYPMTCLALHVYEGIRLLNTLPTRRL